MPFLLVLLARPAQADDSQYRFGLGLKLVDTEYVDLTTYGQFDLSDSAPNPTLYLISERVLVEPWHNLSFGLNYTYIRRDLFLKQIGQEIFLSQHRAEFEIDPHWHLSDSVWLNMRHRLEYRWTQDLPDNIRSRHRVEFVIPVHHLEPLAEVFSSGEFFYDYSRHRNSENRLIPLGLTFRFSEHVYMKTYYMLQAVHVSHDWPISNVLYTQWYISLK